MVINKAARELMIKNYDGKEFEFVQLMMDLEVPNCFWMAPAGENDEGSRRLNAGSGATRSVSCSLLLNQLGYESEKTKSYAVSWDAVNRSIKVDLSQEEGGKNK
jgi:DNA/RNA endonuclease G (NUC1)